jgi:hypothetical protein
MLKGGLRFFLGGFASVLVVTCGFRFEVRNEDEVVELVDGYVSLGCLFGLVRTCW